MNLVRLALASALLTSVSCLGPGDRQKYESPSYRTVASDGAFEIRDYPEVVVVSAPVEASQNSAFMKLFGYISGDNLREQKIEMTTPVFGSSEEDGQMMSFVVPAEVVANGVPPALSPEVSIRKREAGRFAAYRYSGRWTKSLEQAGQRELQAWITEQRLKAIGSYEKANYDSPFTRPSARRNEILVRIAK